MIWIYLIIAAWIDYKTKQVYRIGSVIFIAVSVCLFCIRVDKDLYTVIEKLSSIMIFHLIVILQGKCSMMGWGDVLTYIGIFFWLGSWDYHCMTIEFLAVYMLLANVLFLIFNIRKLDRKTRKMKEETAFLPALAAAAAGMKLMSLMV